MMCPIVGINGIKKEFPLLQDGDPSILAPKIRPRKLIGSVNISYCYLESPMDNGGAFFQFCGIDSRRRAFKCTINETHEKHWNLATGKSEKGM